METKNPYLYEELHRAHYQELLQQAALDRLAQAQQPHAVLQWVARRLLHLGQALQRYSERPLHRSHAVHLLDQRTQEKLSLSR